MDNKQLLVKSIVLLYRESLLENKEKSSDLVKTALETIQISDVSLTINHERDILIALKQTALEMCDAGSDVDFEKQTLLHTLKMNVSDDEKLYDHFVSGIEPDLKEDSIKKSIVNLRNSIQNHFRENQISELLGKAAAEFKFRREKIKDVGAFVSGLIGQLDPLVTTSKSTKDPAILSEVDLSNEDSTVAIFKEIKTLDEGTTVMRTGWQGVNRMLQGGFRPGDMIGVGARQHNFKTGCTLSMFRDMCRFNTPVLIDPNKKPLMLRISFEDDVSQNMQFLYQTLREEETGKKVVIRGIDEKEMAAYVTEKLQATGFHVKLLRVDPTLWTYRSLCNYILQLESEGYEIKVCAVDYLKLMPTTGCTVGPMGADIQDLFRRTRLFMNPKKIICMTPHQLSSEANQLVRDGRTDFIKEVVGKNYWEGSKGISRELDIEIIINIEKLNKMSYLTIGLGKHRLPTVIDDADRFPILQFHKIGTIPADVDKADSTLKKLGGGPIGSGEEIPFWEANSQV